MFKKILTTGAVTATVLMFAAAGAAPAVAAGPNLINNGGFDGAGYDYNNGAFVEGDNFDGWIVGAPSGRVTNPVLVWFPEMQGPGATFGAPFTDGPWVRVMGTLSQRVPTEIGKTYTLTYDVRASGSDANDRAAGWRGGNMARVGVDGIELDAHRTTTDPLYTTYSVNFTATEAYSLVYLSNTLPAGGAVGFDNISVTLVDENDSPVMLPAIAGGIGVAALAAGSAFLVGRKPKRSGE